LDKLKYEDIILKDVKSLHGGPDWKSRVVDREGWKIRYDDIM